LAVSSAGTASVRDQQIRSATATTLHVTFRSDDTDKRRPRRTVAVYHPIIVTSAPAGYATLPGLSAWIMNT